MTITMKNVRQAADRLRERGGSSCVFTMHSDVFAELENDPEFRAYHQTRDSMDNGVRVYGVEFHLDDTKPTDYAVMTATISQTVPVQTVLGDGV